MEIKWSTIRKIASENELINEFGSVEKDPKWHHGFEKKNEWTQSIKIKECEFYTKQKHNWNFYRQSEQSKNDRNVDRRFIQKRNNGKTQWPKTILPQNL